MGKSKGFYLPSIYLIYCGQGGISISPMEALNRLQDYLVEIVGTIIFIFGAYEIVLQGSKNVFDIFLIIMGLVLMGKKPLADAISKLLNR